MSEGWLAELEVERQINQHPNREIVGWQVYWASTERWGRNQRIPAGSYWAAHYQPREPLVIADTLEELEKQVLQRREEMAAEQRWAERSALERILPPRD